MIYKLNKERNSWQYIIPRLNDMWNLMNRFANQLQNSAGQIDTDALIDRRTSLVKLKNDFEAFSGAFGAWFESEYPEYSNALDGAISSLDSIISYITTLGENYKDAETGKYIMTDLTQNDRDSLASYINSQLE